MTPLHTLLDRIETRQAVVGIVGLGYVGLPLAMRFAEVGFKVLGFDIDPHKVHRIAARDSYIEHISNDKLAAAVDAGFSATTDFARAGEPDALVPHLREGQLVSLESTTYPGTTDEELRPRIERRGLVLGETAFLVFSPEREDPANGKFTTRTIPKVVGGSTPTCLKVGKALYGAVIDTVVEVSSTRAAEMTKLLENIHRAVNIGLVNELKIVCDRMGLDIHEIIRAAATKPFGFVPYYPGPGLGGHCIPIDPFYLTWKAREYGVHTRFIELAGEINSSMPQFVISKLADALNERSKAIKGSRVLVLGLAYKKNVDDPRESPSAVLMELLRARGAHVDYSDPHIPAFPKMREHKFELSSVPLTPQTIASYDALLLATDHDKFDYELLRKHARLIIDTRGRYAGQNGNVVKA
ncbi:MAG TPA: nucleotide sugar dehydrogenase [Burkholderiaceae bacterium]|nr:nucleotide sugar dehydrogenase [Burkholderiaceae bacterium]